MRARLMTLGLLLLAACSSGDDGPDGPGGSSEVQLVGGQVVCDSCESVRIVVAGPGIDGVRSATLVTSDVARTTLPARISIDRESGASGDRLVVTAFFDQGVPEGRFDLWLDPLSAGDAARVVPAALLVSRARPGPGTLGTIRVWVQVAGVDRDMGFALQTVEGCSPVDCAPLPVEAFTSATRSLPPGTYTFRLDDVAENCTVEGSPNPATLTLQRGVSTALSYRLTCGQVANPGWVRVSTVTTGVDLDDEYKVSCSGLECRAFTLAANRDTVLRFAPGELRLGVSDVAGNCTLGSANPAPATVTAGDTASVTIAVTCRERPVLHATVRTTGRQIDDALTLVFCDGDYYYGGCTSRTISPNGTTTFPGLQPGYYVVSVGDVAANCTFVGQSWYGVNVQFATVEVVFEIECSVFATVRIEVAATGSNTDVDFFDVVHESAGCDDWYYTCPRQSLRGPGSVEFRTLPGPQSFRLEVPSNCALVAPGNPASVTAIEDGVVNLRFEVTCQ